ncbi:phosphoribosyl-AMP cyclohydrolase [Alteromonas oceanisediminis]|uniref:phosphoribosyl-AMP cyclohydrolase n=1 Tax=Alteromonas oceanisediminis TaxID=2836180 RepID=UPI001BDAC857|nr:phosphoribosyl-AMP cyclohydrolase [Alteromonas oceanisediminis]MBT0587574.1 phosphoribosyl-AMP cyclohydrolase [Alteromonas oceanisediminis]
MNTLYSTSIGLLSLATAASLSAAPITVAEVEAAQKAWGDGIVKIGQAKDAKAAAVAHIDKFYAFDSGTVLFKPTLASVDQFRGTEKEALSYFIGQDMKEDNGFALAPYTNVRWENEGIITDGDSAMSMGNYFFTKTNGEEVKVEYSFGYMKDDEGNVKINLHHSSLPYTPN